MLYQHLKLLPGIPEPSKGTREKVLNAIGKILAQLFLTYLVWYCGDGTKGPTLVYLNQ